MSYTHLIKYKLMHGCIFPISVVIAKDEQFHSFIYYHHSV